MIALIVAKSKNNIIGKNNKIPWRIDGEQHQFKKLTTNQIVVIGRKTYESIGHPLPDRMTIVVSKRETFNDINLITVKSLADALAYANGKDIYIAGGYQLYKQAMDIVDKMFITIVDTTIDDGDTVFPEFDPTSFKLIEQEFVKSTINYTRYTYERVK